MSVKGQDGFERAEREHRQISERLRRANGAVEISEAELDLLTVLLIIEVILLPLSVVAGTDVYPMVLYAMAITAAFFALFFAVNVLGERSAGRQVSRLRQAEAEEAAARVVLPERPR
jgi:hypothetical protein